MWRSLVKALAPCKPRWVRSSRPQSEERALQKVTFALGQAAGVQIGGGGAVGAGCTLRLALQVLVGAPPAALTHTKLQGVVGANRAQDCTAGENG